MMGFVCSRLLDYKSVPMPSAPAGIRPFWDGTQLERNGMNWIIVLPASAFAVGFVWGYRKPATYCSISRQQAHEFANRFSSGLINGAVLGAIAGVASLIAFGT